MIVIDQSFHFCHLSRSKGFVQDRGTMYNFVRWISEGGGGSVEGFSVPALSTVPNYSMQNICSCKPCMEVVSIHNRGYAMLCLNATHSTEIQDLQLNVDKVVPAS
jgi:hypothetical protein